VMLDQAARTRCWSTALGGGAWPYLDKDRSVEESGHVDRRREWVVAVGVLVVNDGPVAPVPSLDGVRFKQFLQR
jgi:hypothetical protein